MGFCCAKRTRWGCQCPSHGDPNWWPTCANSFAAYFSSSLSMYAIWTFWSCDCCWWCCFGSSSVLQKANLALDGWWSAQFHRCTIAWTHCLQPVWISSVTFSSNWSLHGRHLSVCAPQCPHWLWLWWQQRPLQQPVVHHVRLPFAWPMPLWWSPLSMCEPHDFAIPADAASPPYEYFVTHLSKAKEWRQSVKISTPHSGKISTPSTTFTFWEAKNWMIAWIQKCDTFLSWQHVGQITRCRRIGASRAQQTRMYRPSATTLYCTAKCFRRSKTKKHC